MFVGAIFLFGCLQESSKEAKKSVNHLNVPSPTSLASNSLEKKSGEQKFLELSSKLLKGDGRISYSKKIGMNLGNVSLIVLENTFKRGRDLKSVQKYFVGEDNIRNASVYLVGEKTISCLEDENGRTCEKASEEEARMLAKIISQGSVFQEARSLNAELTKVYSIEYKGTQEINGRKCELFSFSTRDEYFEALKEYFGKGFTPFSKAEACLDSQYGFIIHMEVVGGFKVKEEKLLTQEELSFLKNTVHYSEEITGFSESSEDKEFQVPEEG